MTLAGLPGGRRMLKSRARKWQASTHFRHMMHSRLSNSWLGTTPVGQLAEAGAAFHAVAFDELQLHQGNPAEEAVEGAQGAEHPAEKPADEDGGDEDQDEDGELVPEEKAHGFP